MAVSTQSFCDLASKIHSKNLNNAEICHRCSINRAYYGAYHMAAKYLGFDTTDEGTKHTKVINALKLDKRFSYLGDMLGTLFWLRWQADYDLSCRLTKSEAEKVLKEANTIMAELENAH